MIKKLSNRELEIADLVSRGLSNREIYEKLCISSSTLQTHLTNIYDKLRIYNNKKMCRIKLMLIYLEEKGYLKYG